MTTADEKRAYDRCHRRPGCAARTAVCRERNEHAHHRHTRGQGGPTVDENLLNVCRPCHDLIHANPAWSYRHGFLVHDWDSYDLIQPTTSCTIDCTIDHRPGADTPPDSEFITRGHA